MVESLILDVPDHQAGALPRLSLRWGGFAAEHIVVDGKTDYSYKFTGQSHYLALHDLWHEDGEIIVDGLPRSQCGDIRNTVTYLPQGCTVSGWTKPKPRKNSVTVLYFDPYALREVLGQRYTSLNPQPFVHVHNWSLCSTLQKLQALVQSPDPDDLQAESLCLLAAIEVLNVIIGSENGRLSERQFRRVFDFIAEHLHENFGVTELADVAGLTRFHFSRAFKNVTGRSPYSYVLAYRVEQSIPLLEDPRLSLEAVARAVGFHSVVQFSRAFRELKGLSPAAYRRSVA